MLRLYLFILLGALLMLPGMSHAAEIGFVQAPESSVAFIFLTGSIENGDENKFHDIVAGQKKVIVVLDSDGGTIVPALAIGSWISLHNYSTAVYGGHTCASACALIWLAGKNKYVSKGFNIGFHAAYIESGSGARENGAANATIGAYLEILGYSVTFIQFATQAPPSGMKWLTHEDILRFGIQVHDVSD